MIAKLALDHVWGMLTRAQVAELKDTAYEVYEACQHNHERLWHRPAPDQP